MANKLFKGDVKCYESGVIKLYGNFTTSTSGTISAQSCKGFSVAKTGSETGRYTVTLDDTYTALLGVGVNVVGSSDAAYTSTKGLINYLRNVSVADSTPTFDIQFVQVSIADAELLDAAKVYIEITLKNSTAF